MEKDLSLILLLIAGIILLFLFVYSFRTRADRPKHESLDLSHSDNFLDDANDVLTMPSDNPYKIKGSSKIHARPALSADALSSQTFGGATKDSSIHSLKPTSSLNASKRFLDDFEDSDAIVLKPTIKEPVAGTNSLLSESTGNYSQTSIKIKEPVLPAVKPALTTPKPAPIETPENFKPSKLLMLHVLPPENEKFIGFDLLQALLVANLRIGDMSIFHRYTLPMGKGNILFSVAQACEPGTFNMNTIGSCQCPGLVLFMQLEGLEHNLDLLELFVQTAQQLADNLGGVVVSQKRNNPFTQEIKKHFVASVQHHLANLGVKV